MAYKIRDYGRLFKGMGILSVLLMAAVFIAVSGIKRVEATPGFYFEKDHYTFYEGNEKTLNLICDGKEYFQNTEEFENDWGSYFKSSDEDVVRVDLNGNVTCVGTGTAEIIVYYLDREAICSVTVKAGNLKISETELTLYSYQSVNVKISGVSKLKKFRSEYQIYDSIDDYTSEDAPVIKSTGKGNFTITAGKKGDYKIRLIGVKKNGTVYSRTVVLHTIEVGPDRLEVNVAPGCSNKLNMINATLISVDLVKWKIGNYSYYPEDFAGICPISSDGYGGFTADEDAEETNATYQVTFETIDGSRISLNVVVSTYLPEYEPFSGYLWVGQKYWPNVVNIKSSSVIRCKSSNPDVLGVDENGGLVPLKGGKATLTVWVDGKEFTDSITVVDSNVHGNNILTWPGASFSFNISGASEDVKIKFSSSNDEVASVTKKGKMKIKKIGFTLVTVSIGEYDYYYTVNVSGETQVKAALAAASVVGKATYSQDKRMEEGYYDCSSLVWRSYAEAGLKIKNKDYAPTAADLAKYLEEQGYTISYSALTPEELLPGDFLFSSTAGSYNGRYMNIDHVAMYYSTNYGSGTLVHAGSRGGGVYFSDYPSYLNIVMIARIQN